MKNHLKTFSFFLLVILGENAYTEQVTFATSQSFEPYTINTDNTLTGIDVELGKELHKRLKMDTQYEVMPWTRQLAYAEKGLVAGILTVYCDDKKPFLEISEEHFYEVKISLFGNKDRNQRIKINSFDDLAKGAVIGIVRDNYFSDLLDSRPDITKELTHSTSLLPPKLALNRIDYVLEEYAPFRHYAKKLGHSEELKEVFVARYSKVCTAFSKKFFGNKAKQVAESASVKIKQIRDEGLVEKIMHKYLY